MQFLVFKKMIEPLQMWLLTGGRCVGCGKELKLGKRSRKGKGEDFIVCECKRVYVYDNAGKKYRRALLNELS